MSSRAHTARIRTTLEQLRPIRAQGRSVRFQFHVSTLLICITISAVAFSLIASYGFEGFWERLVAAVAIAAIFAPLIEFYYWWKHSGFED